MRILIAAVGQTRGRQRHGPEAALVEEYLRRLPWQVLLSEVAPSRAAEVVRRKAEEAAALDRLLPAGHALVALDEQGEDMPSRELAGRLHRLRLEGQLPVAFVIGGPDGLAPALCARARFRLAFGRQTWPHLMVRAMLAEQIYRAYTILEGHPYHRA